jgi:molybdopterin biosynthesis enzyme
VAGFVGDDDEAARQMADEMLGGVDALVTLGGGEGSAGGATTPGLSPDA